STNGCCNTPKNELRDFDLNTPAGYVGLQEDQIQRNIAPAIRSPGHSFDPGAQLGSDSRGPRADIYGRNFDTYFTLSRDSPSLFALGFSSADILVNNSDGQGPGFHVFAPHVCLGQTGGCIGLQVNDGIDALALDRAFVPP